MALTCIQRPMVGTGSTRLARVDFTEALDSGVSLTGTPTVTEVTTSALTLGNKIVTTESYVDDDGITVAAGKAIQFTVTGGAAGTAYTVLCTVSTDSSPAETIPCNVVLTYV